MVTAARTILGVSGGFCPLRALAFLEVRKRLARGEDYGQEIKKGKGEKRGSFAILGSIHFFADDSTFSSGLGRRRALS